MIRTQQVQMSSLQICFETSKFIIDVTKFEYNNDNNNNRAFDIALYQSQELCIKIKEEQ